MTIVYLHGFISAPQSHKAQISGDYMAERGWPTGSCARAAPPAGGAIEQVEDASAQRPATVTLVGSSLGGFYATVMAERLGCRAALLNPAVHPHRLPTATSAPRRNLYTGEAFVLTREHVEDLRALDWPAIIRPSATGSSSRPPTRCSTIARRWRTTPARCTRWCAGGDHSLVSFPEHIPGIVEWARRDEQVLFEEDGAFRVGTILAEHGRLAPGRGAARQALEGEGRARPAALRRPGARPTSSRRRSSPRRSTRSSCGRCAGATEFGFDDARARVLRPRAHAASRRRRCAQAAREPDLLLQARQGPLPGGAGGEPQGGARRRREAPQAAGAGRRLGRESSPRAAARAACARS